MTGFGSSENKNSRNLKDVKTQGEILHAQGVRLQKSGQVKSAEECYSKALRIGYCHPGLLINLAVIYKNKNKDNDAKLMLEKSIGITESSTAYNLLGTIYQKQGNLNSAMAAIKKSIQFDSTNYRTYLIEASIYKDMKKSEEAVNSINKSISLNENDSESYLSLGIIYKDKGEYKKALEYTKKSIQLEAGNIKAYINLSDILKDTMNSEGAIDCLNYALKIDPSNTILLLRLARLYFKIGKYTNVETILQNIKTDEDQASTWKILEAANLFETQQYEKAKAKLTELKRKNIDNEMIDEEVGIALKAVEHAIKMDNEKRTDMKEGEQQERIAIQLNREVEESLMEELNKIQVQELSKRKIQDTERVIAQIFHCLRIKHLF